MNDDERKGECQNLGAGHIKQRVEVNDGRVASLTKGMVGVEEERKSTEQNKTTSESLPPYESRTISSQPTAQAPPSYTPFVPQLKALGFWQNWAPHHGHLNLYNVCFNLFIQAT
jgi:hypothetical protein